MWFNWFCTYKSRGVLNGKIEAPNVSSPTLDQCFIHHSSSFCVLAGNPSAHPGHWVTPNSSSEVLVANRSCPRIDLIYPTIVSETRVCGFHAPVYNIFAGTLNHTQMCSENFYNDIILISISWLQSAFYLFPKCLHTVKKKLSINIWLQSAFYLFPKCLSTAKKRWSINIL